MNNVKTKELRTEFVAQSHLLQTVVLVVVDDQATGVVQVSRFELVVEITFAAAD